ncbi:MAG: SHOCT domain-containing protein [Anaerolineae bacterium]
MMHYWGTGGMGPIGMLLMLLAAGLAFLVFAGLVTAAVWAAVRSRRVAGSAPVAGAQALAVLQERYARGELTREQFEQMRRDIAG